MRRVFVLVILLLLLPTTVFAVEFEPPTVPEDAQEFMPPDTESFGEGLWFVVRTALMKFKPEFIEALRICICFVSISVLIALLKGFSGENKWIGLVGVLTASTIFIQSADTFFNLGASTVEQLSEYGKLLLPVITAAFAAQGGVTGASALYAGTALFNSILSTAISKLLMPTVYIYLCLCIANAAIGEKTLQELRDFVKWLMTWILKWILYIFTGYIGITGVVSGATDAAALKATKIAISGSVPVVGSILSDATESILVGAGVMKNAVGIYGVFALLSICIGPFMKIGVHYLLLKFTASICGMVSGKEQSGIIKDFSGVMGFLLAMTGSVCLLLLISIVCFMKGVA